MLSAFNGTLVAALFVEKRSAVGSSGALYGLLGATLSALIQNWELYTNKVYHLLFFFIEFDLFLMIWLNNVMIATSFGCSSQLSHQYYLSWLEISSLVCYPTWITFQTLEVLYQGSYLDLYFYPVLKSEKWCKEKEASWTIILKVLSSRGWGKSWTDRSIEVSVFFSLYLCECFSCYRPYSTLFLVILN